MACGTPVLTSNVSSLPEVVGEAALSVSPEDTDAISDALLQLANDEALCADLRTRGLERAKQFTWRKTAELTLETNQAHMLQERLAEVEPAAAEAADLRREVQDLNRDLSHSQTVMAREVGQRQASLQQEQEARRECEELVVQRNSDIEQLKTENQRLSQRLEDLPNQVAPKLWELIQPMQQEIEELRQLQVWAGHPCSKCGKPTPGVTSREVAAKLLREGGYGHGECIKNRSWW